MKKFGSIAVYFLICLFLISFAGLSLLGFPKIADSTQAILVNAKSEIPQKSSALGIEKYNLPPTSKGLLPPSLTAKSVIIKDLETGEILFMKDPNERLPIASTTKIMTALVANSYYQDSSLLTASTSANTSGSTIGLKQGETLSFRALLYGMLLNSGNDAAFDIAENYPGGVSGFVEAMNKKAADLNLVNTHFDNPAGFDSINHFSTASDLSIITEQALKRPILARIFATKDTEIVSSNGQKHQLHNLNQLLSSVAGVLGVKTGYTDVAKENLVTYVDRGGHKIITVVLGSDDRFGESTNLIEWTYRNFEWR